MSRQSTRGGKSLIVKCFTAFHADFGVQQLENPQGCHYEAGAIYFPWLLWMWPPTTFIENGPKETPSCLIPYLLVVFTQQLEILATSLIQDHWDKITWRDSGCPSSKTFIVKTCSWSSTVVQFFHSWLTGLLEQHLLPWKKTSTQLKTCFCSSQIYV